MDGLGAPVFWIPHRETFRPWDSRGGRKDHNCHARFCSEQYGFRGVLAHLRTNLLGRPPFLGSLLWFGFLELKRGRRGENDVGDFSDG